MALDMLPQGPHTPYPNRFVPAISTTLTLLQYTSIFDYTVFPSELSQTQNMPRDPSNGSAVMQMTLEACEDNQ